MLATILSACSSMVAVLYAVLLESASSRDDGYCYDDMFGDGLYCRWGALYYTLYPQR
jgi:hypothetical protein